MFGERAEAVAESAEHTAAAIRNQPRAGAAEHGSYDRTALDRMLAEAREVSEADKIAIRNKTLREAAQMVLLLDLLDAVETQRMPMWQHEEGEVERVTEEIGA